MKIFLNWILIFLLCSCTSKFNQAAYKELSMVEIENLDNSLAVAEVAFNIASSLANSNKKQYILKISCDEKFKLRSYNSPIEEGALALRFKLYKNDMLLYSSSVALEIDLPTSEDLYEGYANKQYYIKQAYAIAAEQISTELLLFFIKRNGQYN